MNAPKRFALAAFLVAAAVVPLRGQSSKPAKKSDAAASSAAAVPRVQVAVESVLDRRSNADFPGSSMTVTLKLDGEDAAAVRSARPKVTRAVDDGGKNLTERAVKMQRGNDGWQESRGDKAPTPELDLGSPSRKAKTIASLEGVLEVYLPSRDPAGSVKIDKIVERKDKPLAVPALASQKIQIQPLSKAGLEREKKQAEAKKADAAKKKKKADGAESAADALADTLTNMLEMLFTTAGQNDLILKVADPGKKVFGFDLAAADGSPIQSYGTTDYGEYRIVRMFEPIPPTASLVVRLKTPRSFGEVPFALTNVKLP